MPAAATLWIMCAVIVIALAAWLIAVALAARRPYPRRPVSEPRRGRVQGGTHVGGGRSVAPHRDSPVEPGEDPEQSTLPDSPQRDSARHGAPRQSGSPLDL